MPYKDKEKQKKVNKERMALVRRIERDGKLMQGNTTEGNTEKVTQDIETVPASYIQGIAGMFKTLPKRPRYLTLSDGQVLDRANQPTSDKGDPCMYACNESSYNFKPRKG